MTLSTSLLAPAGVKLQPAALRPAAAGRLSFLCYVSLSVSNTITFPTLPGFTVTVAPTISTAAPQQFFYAVSDPTVTNVQLAFDTEGPARVNGQTLTFAPAANPLTLVAGQHYIFAFYATSSPSASRLYVVNGGSNSVSVFDVAHAYAPLPPITGGGLHVPFGVTIDDRGILYVANNDGAGHHSVSVFDTGHGNAALPRITGDEFTSGTSTLSLAVDTRGRLYATTDAGVVVIDTLHGNAQLPPITGGGLSASLTGVAVDPSGKLYVANASGGFHSGPSFITIFDTLTEKPLPSITDGNYEEASSLAVDSNGKLYAANFSLYNAVSVYDTLNGNAELLHFYLVCVPPVSGSLCGAPIDGLAIDTSGRLYVPISTVDIYNVQINEVLVFDTAHGNVELPTIKGNGLNGPGGVAVY